MGRKLVLLDRSNSDLRIIKASHIYHERETKKSLSGNSNFFLGLKQLADK